MRLMCIPNLLFMLQRSIPVNEDWRDQVLDVFRWLNDIRQPRRSYTRFRVVRGGAVVDIENRPENIGQIERMKRSKTLELVSEDAKQRF